MAEDQRPHIVERGGDRWTIVVSLDGRAVLGGAKRSEEVVLSQDVLPHRRVEVVPAAVYDALAEHADDLTAVNERLTEKAILDDLPTLGNRCCCPPGGTAVECPQHGEVL